ncbi:prephenate dehydratase [Gephyromycinifex aptenodytis]|uniref:prephenate dehydratase n=1 Tax=Gephyromycinifex aptenodytis TaxID=2716227 RepID=UPI0014450F53|nr:prephenate dehydratase [Gephyromycinifex aptenodytis]
MSNRVGYLGPAGTFTQMALNAWPSSHGAEHVPYPTVDAALAAVRVGDIDSAVVAMENSVEGGVTATLDALATGAPLHIIGEVLVPIRFVLAARPGTTLEQITAVSTHSHAWAQVRGWMNTHLPQVTFLPALSNAAAAVELGAAEEEGTPAFQAAVCPRIAADNNGLIVLASDIGDVVGAVTRFAVVARPGHLPPPTGSDKTTIVLYQRDDRPGRLLELLEQFAVRGINLTRLESRPTKESLGRYCFSVDLEGHIAEERIGETLMGLHRISQGVRFVGSYPRADRRPTQVHPDHDDEGYIDARAWLMRLRRP